MNDIIAIVPARGGSKGVPDKNIRILNGKPLIIHTLNAALESRCFKTIIVTTDSKEIRNIVLEYGFDCPFLRPAALSQDDTPLIKAVSHALEYAEFLQQKYDSVCLLQPTSPFRTGTHIREVVDIFNNSDCDTVVSINRVPHRFVPSSLMKIKNGYLENYKSKSVSVSRHDDPVLFARNGPAVLISTAGNIRKQIFYGEKVMGYTMDKISSIDIDDQEDWDLAERIAGND